MGVVVCSSAFLPACNSPSDHPASVFDPEDPERDGAIVHIEKHLRKLDAWIYAQETYRSLVQRGGGVSGGRIQHSSRCSLAAALGASELRGRHGQSSHITHRIMRLRCRQQQ